VKPKAPNPTLHLGGANPNFEKIRPMNALRLTALLTVCANLLAAEPKYELRPDFLGRPAGRETIGNGHGEIAVDSASTPRATSMSASRTPTPASRSTARTGST